MYVCVCVRGWCVCDVCACVCVYVWNCVRDMGRCMGVDVRVFVCLRVRVCVLVRAWSF